MAPPFASLVLVDVVALAPGTQDTWIPPDHAHRLHALILGSTLQLIDGAGHLIQLDAPDELAVAIDRSLSRQG